MKLFISMLNSHKKKQYMMAVLLFKKSRSAANIHCGKTWNWKSQCWEFCGCLHMPLTKIQGTLSFNSLKWLLENTLNYRLWNVMQANRHNLKFNCLAAQYKKSETSASRRSLADSQRWKLLCGGPWPQIKFLIPFWLKMTSWVLLRLIHGPLTEISAPIVPMRRLLYYYCT